MSLTTLILMYVAWCAGHSLLAQTAVKQALARWLGAGFESYVYRGLYSLLMTITFIPLLAGFLFAQGPDNPVIYQVHGPARYVLYGLQLLGLLIIYASFRPIETWEFLGFRQWRAMRRRSDHECTYPSRDALVTTGLYRFSRNPMMVGSVLLIACWPTMTRFYAAFAALSVLYILVGVIVEERKLSNIFGDAYRAYQRVAPQYIPWQPRHFRRHTQD